ncbi:hypothetical protein CYMTET_56711 [Cymbomonas tetramitiformis]|uniref:Uncharacterized protein n=1 Tax=Cymbomonas tetramitiformis TaxID=36881 RepID=A0AAE0BC56_9CHLO|nr:hypothetical protein CYMTET_56711 [Cymbomonas tetramitiformis]
MFLTKALPACDLGRRPLNHRQRLQHRRPVCPVLVSKSSERFTAGGGGDKGFCDIEQIKQVLADCKNLPPEVQEACWADAGCDIALVTEHYSKVAGLDKSDIPESRMAQAEKQTTAGGGYNGYCDIQSIKQTLEDCKGLSGAALEACWADSGCDIKEVTKHYSKVAGLED